jgi:hypothetical protein
MNILANSKPYYKMFSVIIKHPDGSFGEISSDRKSPAPLMFPDSTLILDRQRGFPTSFRQLLRTLAYRVCIDKWSENVQFHNRCFSFRLVLYCTISLSIFIIFLSNENLMHSCIKFVYSEKDILRKKIFRNKDDIHVD